MNCGGCAKAVTRALHAVDAEAKVEVDLKGGIVAVTGTPGIGAERFIDAVRAAGYGAEPLSLAA
mgnify:CR=1 FL=1|jgi:copper chaperone